MKARIFFYFAVGVLLLAVAVAPADRPLQKNDPLCLIGAIKDCSK